MSEATFIALKFEQGPNDPDLAWRLLRQQISDSKPGWTMEYIDSLSWREVNDLIAYMDGKAKAQQ